MKFFDWHCDTLTKCMDRGEELYENNMQNSLSKLLKYDTPCQIFAVYTDDEHVEDAYDYAKKAIKFYNEQKTKYSDYLTDFSTGPDKKRVNGILSLEGGEPVDSLEALDEFYEMGVRLMTLTWNRSNKIGHGALSGCTSGLTAFGKDVVRAMDKKKMIVDVSHLNSRGTNNVFDISDMPVVATHSNSRVICDHKRNLTDRQIEEIRDRGGIIGINLYPPFLSDKGEADIKMILKHIDHMLYLGCENTLCLGCDFDGISTTPKEINSVEDMPKLYKAIKDAFGEEITDKIFFENAIGFWESIYDMSL